MRSRRSGGKALEFFCGLFLAFHLGAVANAQLAFKTLVSFTGTNGLALGAIPEPKLLLARDGNFYGTTIYGGSNNLGTIFKITTNGTLSTLVELSASTGYGPQAGLAQGIDGYLYGTTLYGGDHGIGTAYRITTNGDFTILASFDGMNGFTPSGLIQASDGNLYGTAWQGGTNGYGQYGTVFRLSTNGDLNAIYHFGNSTNDTGVALDGSSPQAALVQASDQALYGTTTAGGTNGGFGSIFRITTNGVFTSLASFDGTNGANPIGALAEAPDGSLLAATVSGGLDFNGSPYTGNGTIFQVRKSGDLTILHYFAGYPSDGAQPNFIGLTLGTDGAWYGTTEAGGTNGSGTAFRMTSAGSLEVLYSFSRSDPVSGTNTDGNYVIAGLAQGMDGNFYGVAGRGGAYGLGTVFCLSNFAFSQPLIRSIARTNEIVTVAWQPLMGRSYQLQFKADFNQSVWTNIGNVVSSTGSTATVIDPTAFSATRIYRLGLLP